LPTDAEWDAASLLGKTGGAFPWGSGFPPPDHFANYGVTKDGFEYTSPVGSFPPSAVGLYDLAGNLWEWIGQGCASGGGYLVRGAGWNARNAQYFDLAFHYCFGADLVGHHNVGFRLVLEGPGP
jgi:formylglycine-generating enzyme required for sulfatase activity